MTFIYIVVNIIECLIEKLNILHDYLARWNSVDTYLLFYDLETTGLNPYHSKITEIAAHLYSVKEKKVIRQYQSLVNPEIPIPEKITQITGISDEMVKEKPMISVVMKEFIEFARLTKKEHTIYLIAHNNDAFDKLFLRKYLLNGQYRIKSKLYFLDTMRFAQKLIPELGRYNLRKLCIHFGIQQEHAHRARDDTLYMSMLYEKLCTLLGLKVYSYLSHSEAEGLINHPTMIQNYIYS